LVEPTESSANLHFTHSTITSLQRLSIIEHKDAIVHFLVFFLSQTNLMA